MPYREDIAGCLADTVGPRGVTLGDLAAMLARAKPALTNLARRRDDGSLPLLRLPARRDDLAALADFADEFRRRFDHVLVLGIGGSSLGGATLGAPADSRFRPPSRAAVSRFVDEICPAALTGPFLGL